MILYLGHHSECFYYWMFALCGYFILVAQCVIMIACLHCVLCIDDYCNLSDELGMFLVQQLYNVGGIWCQVDNG